MRSVLIVTSVFPPITNPAVYRIAKFTKHLTAFGWRPIVLCVGPDRDGTRDEALLREIPPEVVVQRVARDPLRRIYQAGSHLLGRPAIGAEWGRLRSARRLGRRLCREHDVRAIVTCSPPKRLPILGSWLQQDTGLPLLHDFQDPPWQLEGTWKPRANQRDYFEHSYREIFARADALAVNTEPVRDEIIGRLGVPAEKVVCIPNGYDEDDFAGTSAQPLPAGSETLSALCAGQPYLDHQEGAAMARALEIAAANPDFREHFRLRILADRASGGPLASPALAGLVDVCGRVPHREAVAEMLGADLNVVTCPERTSARRVPQKLYQYIRAGRPVLALMGTGPGRMLVEDLGLGITCDPKDAEQMADGLLAAFARWREGFAPPPVPPGLLLRFERRQLAGKLAALLDELAGRA